MALLSRSRRSGRRALALSLAFHACAFAGLWCWTGSARAPARSDDSVVSLRVRSAPAPAQPALEEPPAIDRSRIPPKPEWPAVEIEAVRIEDLESSTTLGYSAPESAPLPGLGASPAGRLRAPPAAQAAATAAAPVPAPAAAPAEFGAEAPQAVAGAARALRSPRPVYPRHSVRLEEQGSVRCELEIDASGSVLAVRVLVSSGFERLDRAATEGLLGWRFEASGSSSKLEHTVVFRIE